MLEINESFNQESRDPRVEAGLRLWRAIQAADYVQISAAVQDGADINLDGLPLEAAAKRDDKLALRLLVSLGADIPHAVQKIEARKATIRTVQRTMNMGLLDHVYTDYETDEDRNRANAYTAAINVLNNYQEIYANFIAPAVQVQTQLELLAEMKRFNARMEENFSDKRLSKGVRGVNLGGNKP